MEDEDLCCGLFGVVVPLLAGVVGNGTVEVIECCKAKVHVEIVENLVFWLECTGVHDSQRIVHHLFGVQGHPHPQHHAQPLLLSVQGPGQDVWLRPVGEGGEGELLVELLPLRVVLVVVKMRPDGPRLVQELVASPHQV